LLQISKQYEAALTFINK